MAKKSKIVLSYSPQGGAGKSTMAINAALIYASKGFKTLLVDMSLYGSVVSSLKIRQKSGIGLSGIINLLDINKSDPSEMENLIENSKRSIVNNAGNTGLDVLISANPIKMEGLNEKSTNSIVKIIKNLGYDIVIVDTSPELSIKNLVLIDKADFILLTALQDVSCGWKMLMFKEIAEKFKLSRDKFGIIINRVSKFNGFNNKEFELEIKYKVLYEFPEYTKDFQSYVNRGDLITSKYNKKAFKNFEDMARDLFNAIGGIGKK